MVKISSEDILKFTAVGCGAYGVLLTGAPEKAHDLFMSKTTARSDTVMQYVGADCIGMALSNLAVANMPGDKTNYLKASAVTWAACAGMQLYHGLKSKKQKKEPAIANAVFMTGMAGLIALKLNGNV
eukprot:jgi/Mesvir1/1004/Mv17541-RA.1